MIRANLEALGVKVLSAVNGRQGLELIHGAQPDLIVADLDGLKMDGVHLVKGACRNG
jgi:CheY-like chemotaxis protein